ncbi:CYTH domain-containing protein [Neobacillus notoginsengisoli]|uniref:CYTH domain-containing protein n=1 Tax=Neobacillus notoginsengisoli TaxID=1578198 RepID=A0A417YZX4_9BACI|nr:CYTH domain-containing protein [Neobacillus notoginsengisoli]RHW43231.1 CYTH domain-containing protein [Neobacillus notoginsengisoli]
MNQNIEIEFKNLLEKDEFELVAKEFGIAPGAFRRQVNHYFDTPAFSLKELGAALRIREKSGKYILTLKQPHDVGLLETDQIISAKEAEKALRQGLLPEGGVASQVRKMGVHFHELAFFGSLATTRAEVSYENGLLVLDHSTYLDTEDYELEYEVEDYHIGKQLFESLLGRLGIPIRKTPNKIQRFYTRKLEQ